ncbi:MAG TPA: glucose-6-phosphate dehydrogenase [Thermohalobaculum sp.]|nr:glucose-6-phosphate dehydrogenase [Thermohalobaculum sp.]
MVARIVPVEPFDLVVFGVTGDLARKKLIPALYHRQRAGQMPESARVIGCARSELGREDFRKMVRLSLDEAIPEAYRDRDALYAFLDTLDYLQVDARSDAGWPELSAKLRENAHPVCAFYLAVGPTLFGEIAERIGRHGCRAEDCRVIVEKPIGHDLASARTLNRQLAAHFDEHQIYRIDHYLGKETVQNLMVLRFANALFEPLWRSEHVDHVQITVAERLGVEGRGDYYDRTGALRDMVQNHLLQLLCLVAMEPPARLEQEAIREEKIKVVRSLRPIEGADLAAKTVRAQYRAGVVAEQAVRGYLDEEGIDPESETETFVAIKAEIDNWRWAGVPFYLRTGKRMGYRVSEIVIQFKRIPHLIFGDRIGAVQDNRLVIRLQPDESVKLAMMVKTPGPKIRLKPVHLNLNLADTFEDRSPLAYERLLLDVIKGTATLFMHRSEVEAAWRWVDTIREGWSFLGRRPRTYTAGSWGPEESIALMVRDDRTWYEHLA